MPHASASSEFIALGQSRSASLPHSSISQNCNPHHHTRRRFHFRRRRQKDAIPCRSLMSGDETPYFQYSHMITPKSSGWKERPDHDSGRANATRSTVRGSRRRWDRNRYDGDESSSGEVEDLYKRPQQDGVLNEYIRQIEKASPRRRTFDAEDRVGDT
ncbi:hypothetical protein PHMEG_00036729 [Phytophthora megakarya]|uniref:Uncharacterized protein n=1 Tax=Phytophthora megakarya TaxID=4795 RepID=A0A225UMJ0_9STRA|nr:hypothetical protein PHMEG_00036729 [Phytophthora megakarya]